MAVNQVSSSNFNTTAHKQFSEFKQPKNGYFIQPDSFSAENEDKIDKKKLWIKLGIGVALIGLTSFGAIKAMPKSVVKKFDKFKQFLEKKIENETTNSKTAIFYRTILKASQSFGEKCQGINNIISFKDIWFKRKITDKVPVLDKACRSVTGWFNNIGKFTVRHSYKSTGKKFKTLNEILSNAERELLVRDANTSVTINGETKTVAQWVKLLGVKRQNAMGKFESNFSIGKVHERRQQIDKIMEPLEDKVWAASFGDKSNFMKKDTYFTFVADKFLAVDKAHLGQGIHKLRSEISYNTYDKTKAAGELLQLNKKMLNPKDTISEKLFRELNKQLSEFSACDRHSPRYEALRAQILKNLDAFKNNVSMAKDLYKYDDKILDAVGEHNRIIKEILESSQRGQLDEMLDVYKKLLPEKEYRKLRKEIRESVKSLDNSIRIESVEYFDKLRDLKLGSAPTDILTILFGFGSLGIGLASTDDKDTQASIALKYGIPAIGGMLTSMVVTSMLVSGLKSHFVGFVSGLLLNKAGTYADNYRKAYNARHAQAEQEKQSDKNRVC